SGRQVQTALRNEKRAPSVLTYPVRARAARTAETLGAILRLCLKPAAIAAASRGADAAARTAMTAAVWAKSSLGNAGRGPATIGASLLSPPPMRSSSAFSLAVPERGIWYS